LRLLTWNVEGRVARLDEQAAAVLARGADVVCLQETRLPRRREALRPMTVRCTLPEQRRLAVLIGSGRRPSRPASRARCGPAPTTTHGARTA
ncbi:MAG: hypothetical protein QOC78_2360, partial [Solirubrobacteraceae bacterium]|nr:hypothetical protein [Solirubrobacteraceae bacterium]